MAIREMDVRKQFAEPGGQGRPPHGDAGGSDDELLRAAEPGTAGEAAEAGRALPHS
jgi:hypothetical protein